MRQELIWTEEDQTWGESTLSLWTQTPGDRAKFLRAEDLQAGRALVVLQLGAEEILGWGRIWHAVSQGIMTAEAAAALSGDLETVIGEGSSNIGGNQEQADALGGAYGDLYAIARGSVLDVYRGARGVDPWVMHGEPPQLGGWQIALILVGGAALVASTWVVSKEVAPAWQAVEADRAWAAARAYAEIETNKLRVAAGQPPRLSSWAKLRAASVRRQTSPYLLLGAGAAAGAVAVGGAYVGLTSKRASSRPKRAPRRNPAPRRSTTRSHKAGAKPRTPKRRKNRRRNPTPRSLHDWATADADRAVDEAISRQMKRWPAKPRPADVDELAEKIGGWPTKDEFSHYRAAWAEQVTRRRLAHKQAASPKRTAPTVRANPPKRDARGRFVPRPKGATRRGSRRGGKAKGAGRRRPGK